MSLAKIAKVAKKPEVGCIFEFPGVLRVVGVLARECFKIFAIFINNAVISD